MRTTITLPDGLLTSAKQLAAARGTTLNHVVEDALRAALARREAPQPAVPIPSHAGGRLQAGIDLDDMSALRDMLDGRKS